MFEEITVKGHYPAGTRKWTQGDIQITVYPADAGSKRVDVHNTAGASVHPRDLDGALAQIKRIVRKPWTLRDVVIHDTSITLHFVEAI